MFLFNKANNWPGSWIVFDFRWKEATSANTIIWRFPTVKREIRPIKLQSYAELSYQIPLQQAVLISSSGFVPIHQWRLKVSS